MNTPRPKEPSFDHSGYPTEETLDAIEAWPYTDISGLLDFLRAAWHDYGHIKEMDGRLHFVTGGWSGNEDILGAFKRNTVIYSLLWESSHRGGLVVIRLPDTKGYELTFDGVPLVKAGSPCPRCKGSDILTSPTPVREGNSASESRGCICMSCGRVFYVAIDP